MCLIQYCIINSSSRRLLLWRGRNTLPVWNAYIHTCSPSCFFTGGSGRRQSMAIQLLATFCFVCRCLRVLMRVALLLVASFVDATSLSLPPRSGWRCSDSCAKSNPVRGALERPFVAVVVACGSGFVWQSLSHFSFFIFHFFGFSVFPWIPPLA